MRVAVVFLFLCLTCSAQNTIPPANRKAPEININQVLQAPAGTPRTLAGLRGKAVVLEFWATWCGGCIEAIPHLNEMADHFKGKPVVFLSVTDESPNVVQAFLSKRPMSGWVGIDADGATFARYGVLGRPQTILIDPQGALRKAVEPQDVTVPLINDLMAGKSFANPVVRSKPMAVVMDAAKGAPPPLLQCMIRPAAPMSISGFSPGAVAGKEGGRIDYYGVTVGVLLYYAKQYRSDRMVAPPWFDQNRYDVSITVPAGREDLRHSLLEHTLTAAFSLKMRNEFRPISVYVLSGNGTGLHASDGAPSRGVHVTPGQFTGVATPVKAVVATVEKAVDGTEVVDETGLSGNYDFDLHWDKGNVNSLKDALREQLGLTLTKETRQREFLIVESAVQPTTL